MAIEMKRLEEVARVFDDWCAPVRGAQRLLRKGPYRLYVEAGSIPFDDYSFDGRFLLLGSVCNVEAPSGCLQVTEACGKFSVTDLYHVIACDDEEDTSYLGYLLSRVRAASHADMSGQTVRLSEQSVRHIPVPWPEQRVRRAVVRYLKECEAFCGDRASRDRRLFDSAVESYREAAERVALTVELGDMCTIHEGSSLSSEKRSAKGALPVVSSQGVMAHTDEGGIREPCIVIGQAGQYLVGRTMREGAHPLADTVALTVSAQAPLTVDALAIALASLGIRPRLRVVDRKVDALAFPLERVASLSIPLVGEAEREERSAEAGTILRTVAEGERLVREARYAADALIDGLLKGREEALGRCFEPDARGCLTGLVQDVRSDMAHASGGATSSFEAAWELLPLLFLRLVDGGSAWSRVMAAEDARSQVDDELERLAALEEGLSFLRDLTLGTSLLDVSSQRRMIERMNAVNVENESGALLRWLARSNEQEPDAPCPSSVSELVARFTLAFNPAPVRAYDPSSGTGEVLATLKRLVPAVRCTAQTARFSDALASRMAARCEGESLEEMEMAVGSALVADAYEGGLADAVVSVLPPNQGTWTEHAPDPCDARWAFGVPPCNKANLAWVQQAFAHRARSGIAVVAASNAVLHESRGCEPAVRAAMIESGCVRAVVSLPGGLFLDGRAPMSIVVLGDERSAPCEMLFVNALECGETDFSTSGRSLAAHMVDRIVSTVERWAAAGSCAPLPGFARSVRVEEVAAFGDMTPWSFV